MVTASLLTEQCTRTVDGVFRPVGHRKGLLRCPLPLLSPSTGRASWCEDLWRKKESRVSRYVWPLSRRIITSWFICLNKAEQKKHSGGILTHRGRSLSVYYSGRESQVLVWQHGVFWGTKSGYTLACAATTGPRWKVSSDLWDKSRR